MQRLQAGSQQLGLSLSAKQLEQFAHYQTLLLAWNQRINLTRIVTPEEIQIRHFLDALTCLSITGDPSHKRLVDVGTGAGFPGLPLKIVSPHLQLTLVDSVVKKTKFLAAVVAALGLKGVEIVAERAETMGQQAAHREQYDWVMARSVAAMRVLAEYLLPLCRVGGQIVAQKRADVAEEIKTAHHAITYLGGGPPQIHPVQLLGPDLTHSLIVIPKISATPPTYPRRPGRPLKKPL